MTVVVTTYNRRASLERMLQGLRASSPRASQFEVLVAVDGCTDGTAAMLRQFEPAFRMKVIDLTARHGPSAGRNRALGEATGEIVLFLDDDVVPVPGLVEAHLAVHRIDRDAVTIGPMLAPAGKRLAPWLRWEAATLAKQYEAMMRGDYGPTPRQFYTANAAVRLSHIRSIGGFDEEFKRAEDIEFAYRLADRGLDFHFLPEAAVVHDPQRSRSSWLQVAYEYGRHAVIFERDLARNQLQLAYRELPERHPMNRWIARACVGHRWRSALLNGVGRLAMSRDARSRWSWVQMGFCSAIYSVWFWQGVADETGLGRQVWSGARTVTSRKPIATGESAG